ncbi:MAG: glycosyltransferase [Candidatus Omnitrophica bacterium]|nr:glycosyltransferase [Candidatus Omnitrophota bacterium]
MKVSVIIPAYNAQKTIAQTLEAITQQDYSEQFEIIVVDDGSTDQTASVIRSFAHVRYVYQPNAGPAVARNHGAQLAQGDYLVFTDSDCIPHKAWLSRLIQGFSQKDVAVVMGGYGIANGESLLAECIFKEIAFRHNKLLPDFPKVFGSYNFCVKKVIFEQVKGFDTTYRNASGEDNDLSYKITSLGTGGRIYFERKALVDHHHPTEVKKYLKEQFRHGFWRVQMYMTHPGMVKGDGYTFWKDMIEVPWSLFCLLGMLISLSNLITFNSLVCFFILPFLLFELLFAKRMIDSLHKEIFWGFVMFLRSFSRTLGLSTGILMFFIKKKSNKP